MEKKYDHQTQEAQIQQFWHDKAIFRLTSRDVKERPLFSIDTPPPTVSGSLHIGHIFSYTHTDLIARFKRMSGHAVFYPFGFDGNGLPTERFVEKKKGVTAFGMGRSPFIELCLQETASVEKSFQDLFEHMGLSIDWSHVYSTIDARTRALSQQSFIELYSSNYIYRKEEPALYCTSCYTSVAQAELDDTEKETVMTTLPCIADDGSQLLIATTRPEFLAACVAVLYNPEDPRFNHLKGGFVTMPLYGIRVPLIAEESVKIDKGTGLVMCCAFGDSSDVEWIKKHHRPYTQILQKDGRFSADIAIIGGLKVKPARERILTELAAQGLIVEQKKLMHAVNIHERCKNEIEFLSLSQWFVDIKNYKEYFLALGNKVNWHPAYMKSRYDNWVEHINWDWCISRQRFFGIPFPCWHCTTCNHVILASSEQLPLDPQETPYGKPCPACASETIVPDMDVMDTWNTSSLTPKICQDLFLKAYGNDTTDFLPMSMRPQAHDIIRTWAFDTIVKSWMHDQQVPWHDIVISGHVLSGEKQKISKSQGNSPLDPESLLKSYPADVIRYWTAGAQLGTDTAFSENQLKIGNRLIVKLWNAFLFIQEHGEKQTDKNYGAIIDPVNRWIVHQAYSTFSQYKKSFNDYQFHKALEVIERFFWNDWCDNYLELVKDQFFNPLNYSPEQIAETQGVLYQVGYELLQWYAPFLPFITDAIYQELYKEVMGSESIHQTDYCSEKYAQSYPDAVTTVEFLLQAVQQVRKLKSDATLSLKTDIESLALSCMHDIEQALQSVEKVLSGAVRSKKIVYTRELLNNELIKNDNNEYCITLVIESTR